MLRCVAEMTVSETRAGRRAPAPAAARVCPEVSVQNAVSGAGGGGGRHPPYGPHPTRLIRPAK